MSLLGLTAKTLPSDNPDLIKLLVESVDDWLEQHGEGWIKENRSRLKTSLIEVNSLL